MTFVPSNSVLVLPDGSLSRLARFYIYGLHGFFMEICFTAVWELVENGNAHLHGITSIYAFFIYALCCMVIEWLRFALYDKTHLLVRGLIYMITIYVLEFSSGLLLRQFNACPWDYEPYFQGHFMGLVTLEYAPMWYACGVFAELIVIKYTLKLRWNMKAITENGSVSKSD